MSLKSKKTPLKRHTSLVPLSREHHHGLLLSWKIRQGIRKKIPSNRIKKYCDWFFQNQLIPHFEIEEKYIFFILENDDPLVKRALKEHKRLKKLFTEESDPARAISLIEEELESHIRFEERILFNKIQQQATESELQQITKHHRPLSSDSYPDPFWEKNKVC